MTDTTEVTAETEPTVEAAKADDEQLGEAGIAALKSEREARKAAEKERTELAARIKELENRDKSESEKQQEELAEARAQLAELTAAKTRAEVASAKGIPSAVIAGPASASEEDLMAFADALIAWRGAGAGPVIPNEGKTPSSKAQSAADVFADWSSDRFNKL